MAIFAKYDGIDGESKDKDHAKWIEVASFEWEMSRAGDAGSQSRRRGAAIVEDLTLAMEYGRSSPQLQEACLHGRLITTLEIEQTRTSGSGASAVFLRHELKNVGVSAVQVSSDADGPPIVVVANSFEEVKVTYTEYDAKGRKKGVVEYSWRREPTT